MTQQVSGYQTYILGYSGGKDSTAALLWCLENLPPDQLRVVHNPTSATWPMLTLYFEQIEDLTGITIETARAGDRPLPQPTNGKDRQPWTQATNLLDMVRARGRWPSYWQRYCTKYLKTWPLRLYAAEHDDPLLILGERAEESTSRAGRPILGEDVARIPQAYQQPIFRPLLEWSAAKRDDYLTAHDTPPNPIYAYAQRCGCWLCPMMATNRHQITAFMRLFPPLVTPWLDLEQEIGHTWRHRLSLTDLHREANAQPILPGLERTP